MKINYDKTKLMVFNPCKNLDFEPELEFGNDLLEVVDELRLLGVIIRSQVWLAGVKRL